MPNPFRHLKAFAAESAQAVAAAVSTGRITVVNHSYEPPALAHTLDADKLLGIFRAAEGGNTRDYFALLRDVIISDGYIQTLISTRKLAVLGDVLSINPADKDNGDDAATAAFVRQMIEDYDSQQPSADVEFEQFTPWLNALAAMMDGHVGPVSVTEKVWRPSAKPGLRFELQALVPVPLHLLDYSTGRMMILDTDANGGRTGGRHAPDPDRYIVHRGHLLSTPDNWGGPMRSVLVWWLLMNMDRAWWARFLERFGSPFPVGKFDSGDDESRRVLQQAFALAVRIGGLVVSKETEVELIQAAAQQSGDAFEKFRSTGRREIAQTILGQSGTVEGTPGQLGEQKSQENVRQDFRAWDAAALARTLKGQSFAQFVRVNGLRGAVPKAIFGSISPDEQKALGGLLKDIKDAGLEPTDEALLPISEKLGIQVRRVAAPVESLVPFTPTLFSAGLASLHQNDLDVEARKGSADLSQAFRGSLAPIRRIILDSQTPRDCMDRIHAFTASWNPAKTAAVMEAALAAFAAKGAVNAAAPPAAPR